MSTNVLPRHKHRTSRALGEIEPTIGRNEAEIVPLYDQIDGGEITAGGIVELTVDHVRAAGDQVLKLDPC